MTENIWNKLSLEAWHVRENAIAAKTKVGCAIQSNMDNIFTGCNIEHNFRCHDIHASVNAIGAMLSRGDIRIEKILIVAHKPFTPCGSCMDWIMAYGSDAQIAYQTKMHGPLTIFYTQELMPFYPK